MLMSGVMPILLVNKSYASLDLWQWFKTMHLCHVHPCSGGGGLSSLLALPITLSQPIKRFMTHAHAGGGHEGKEHKEFPGVHSLPGGAGVAACMCLLKLRPDS